LIRTEIDFMEQTAAAISCIQLMTKSFIWLGRCSIHTDRETSISQHVIILTQIQRTDDLRQQ